VRARRETITRKIAKTRVPRRRIVTARIRARPRLISRSSRRVFSQVLTVPTLGNVTERRSGLTRIAPVVIVNRSGSRPLRLNLGKPARLPPASPLRLFCQRQ